MELACCGNKKKINILSNVGVLPVYNAASGNLEVVGGSCSSVTPDTISGIIDPELLNTGQMRLSKNQKSVAVSIVLIF